MRIERIEASRVSLPLTRPFGVSKRTAHSAETVLIKVTSGNVTGIGSATPVTYVTGESPDSVLADFGNYSTCLQGMDLERPALIFQEARKIAPTSPSAYAGFEIALWDVLAKATGASLWSSLGGYMTEIQTDFTIPICDCEQARELARDAVAKRFVAIKVKVGDPNGIDADIERIAVIAQATNTPLRIDANQAYAPELAVRFLRECAKITPNVQLMEQPVAADDLPGLKYVKNHTDIPVIADESVVTPADAIRIVSGDCADGINVKIMKSGIQGALDIVAIAKAAGLKLMIGCMLESNPGFCASICLAAGTGLFDFIDLDAHILIAGNTAYTGYGAKNGLIAPYQQYPGWGITT